MLCVDDEGELFIGAARNLFLGKTYRIEVREKMLGSCYRDITSWLTKTTGTYAHGIISTTE